ncbi:aromatic acid exporter family protein [uncultured Pseudokineococcus sp.]|uniref:FUSC family protein n=1 Tax=uncultured Pseudokineococcus sp. TaxID=1642928 RepID=UPI00260811F1|nr:FUSC family protein [uncultured Pseudokineococcus sp.]
MPGSRASQRLDLQRVWQLRAAVRGRRSARERLARLRRRGPNIVQCALAAGAAWAIAHLVLGHATPFFAPVAAVVALGQSYEGRLRRTGEVVVGVALGIGVGDLLASWLGTGVWQLAVVVGLSMALAVLLDAGQLLVTQAGVQASIVTSLAAPASAGLDRWVDALVGGAVALVVAALLPTAPLLRPRRLAAAATGEVALLLAEAAAAAKDADGERAQAALDRARAGQRAFEDLAPAAQEALEGLRLSPFRHRHRPGLEVVRDLAVPLDRAMRNVRVLLRRVAVAEQRGEPLPPELWTLLEELATGARLLSEAVDAGRRDDDLLDDLVDLGRRAGVLGSRRLGLSAAVCVGQLRSTVVDLLQVGGMSSDRALAAVPPVD